MWTRSHCENDRCRKAVIGCDANQVVEYIYFEGIKHDADVYVIYDAWSRL